MDNHHPAKDAALAALAKSAAFFGFCFVIIRG